MSYRRVITRRTITWAAVTAPTRLTSAMGPLGMVFVGHGSAGSYAAGSVLAACFIAGEVIGAAVFGTRIDQRKLRGQLAAGLAAAAVGFGALALLAHGLLLPLAIAALVAGGAPAASPGALRTALAAAVDEKDVAKAFSLDSILTEILWTAAPGLVVLLAVFVAPSAPMVVCAVLLVWATIGVFLLDSLRTVEESTETSRAPLSTVLSGWPVYLTSAAAMSLMAVTELVLAPLLEHRQLSVTWAAPLLMGLAIVSAVSAWVFGLRTWPGSARSQSLVCLLATALGVTAIIVVPGLVGVIAGFTIAGVFQSVVMITRNLSLREHLPESAHTAGFNAMFAVQGIGYSIAAVAAGAVLEVTGPPAAIGAGVALTVVLLAVSAVGEFAHAPRTREPAGDR